MLKETFKGFPSNLKLSGLPAHFFTAVLPHINEFAELKVTMVLLYLMAEKRTQPRFVSLDELINSDMLKQMDRNQLEEGISKAVQRGTFIHLAAEKRNLYFLNAEPERKALEKIHTGELKPGSLEEKAFIKNEKNIFTLYEENIGQLTPMLAEELKEAEKTYSLEWIEEAIKEAVALNKRNWRYISRILERWAVEGKTGKTGRYPSKEFDPQDYFKGRYGHIVHGQKR